MIVPLPPLLARSSRTSAMQFVAGGGTETTGIGKSRRTLEYGTKQRPGSLQAEASLTRTQGVGNCKKFQRPAWLGQKWVLAVATFKATYEDNSDNAAPGLPPALPHPCTNRQNGLDRGRMTTTEPSGV